MQNHRFAIDGANDKKQIKNLLATIEQLEERYDELQKNFDDLQRQLTLTRRQQQNQQPQRKNSTNTVPQNNHNGNDHNNETRLRKNGLKTQDNGLSNDQEILSKQTLQENKVRQFPVPYLPQHTRSDHSWTEKLVPESLDLKQRSIKLSEATPSFSSGYPFYRSLCPRSYNALEALILGCQGFRGHSIKRVD